jgi:nucleotide-binding universal stress UspA family protein
MRDQPFISTAQACAGKEGEIMYKHILVPLDGSVRAEKILPYVEEMALKHGARVILLQVVEPIATVSSADVFIPANDSFTAKLEQARVYLDGVKTRFQEKQIEVETRVVGNTIVDAICETAQTEKSDLIAMASHGRTGAGRVFYGSVAAGVLHRIDRPLLIIRSRGE